MLLYPMTHVSAQATTPWRSVSLLASAWWRSVWRLSCVVALSVYFAPQLLAEVPLTSYRFNQADHRFLLVDNPDASAGKTVADVGEAVSALAVVNGGFYTPEYRPTGYLKVDGEVVNHFRNPKLSGLVLIDRAGRMRVQFRGDIPKEAVSVLQTGPFIIDPGGRLGLHTADYKSANRTVLLGHQNGDISLVFAPSTSLMTLAEQLLRDYPDVDFALNLDGGPVAGLWSAQADANRKINTVTSRNYLAVLPR